MIRSLCRIVTRMLLFFSLLLLMGGCSVELMLVRAGVDVPEPFNPVSTHAQRYVDPQDGTGKQSRVRAFIACGDTDNSSWDVLDACMTAQGYPVKP